LPFPGPRNGNCGVQWLNVQARSGSGSGWRSPAARRGIGAQSIAWLGRSWSRLLVFSPLALPAVKTVEQRTLQLGEPRFAGMARQPLTHSVEGAFKIAGCLQLTGFQNAGIDQRLPLTVLDLGKEASPHGIAAVQLERFLHQGLRLAPVLVQLRACPLQQRAQKSSADGAVTTVKIERGAQPIDGLGGGTGIQQ